MSYFILVAAALLPAIVLCIYVFKKDRVEKEPLGLLLKLLLFGVLCCFPAAYAENIVNSVIGMFFAEQAMYTGAEAVRTGAFYMFNLLKYFIGVALVEELAKFVVLILVTRKNREFNSLFDGMIYSIFVSLGFAALENVLYVLSEGFTVAVMRAFLSVPGHMFFAVMMGYHYSIWHITDKAIMTEKALIAKGLLKPAPWEYDTKKSIVKCLLVPVLAHGLYDYCCVIGTGWSILALIVFVIYMYIHCFGKIKKMSKADAYERDYVKAMLAKKYPDAF